MREPHPCYGIEMLSADAIDEYVIAKRQRKAEDLASSA
jgi:hypothetical protein